MLVSALPSLTRSLLHEAMAGACLKRKCGRVHKHDVKDEDKYGRKNLHSSHRANGHRRTQLERAHRTHWLIARDRNRGGKKKLQDMVNEKGGEGGVKGRDEKV
eukprot:6204023-Pleurochrysis_carterae.AAC.1